MLQRFEPALATPSPCGFPARAGGWLHVSTTYRPTASSPPYLPPSLPQSLPPPLPTDLPRTSRSLRSLRPQLGRRPSQATCSFARYEAHRSSAGRGCRCLCGQMWGRRGMSCVCLSRTSQPASLPGHAVALEGTRPCLQTLHHLLRLRDASQTVESVEHRWLGSRSACFAAWCFVPASYMQAPCACPNRGSVRSAQTTETRASTGGINLFLLGRT